MKIPTKDELRAKGEISCVFRLIKGHEARNSDGSHAGWRPGTPEGDQECVEMKCIGGEEITYTNYWQ